MEDDRPTPCYIDRPHCFGCSCLDIIFITFAATLVFSIYYGSLEQQKYNMQYNNLCGYGKYIEGKCVCYKYYASIDADDICRYKRKSMIIALIYQFWLGLFGGGWFYIGKISVGIAELLGFIIYIVMYKLYKKYDNVIFSLLSVVTFIYTGLFYFVSLTVGFVNVADSNKVMLVN